MNHGVYRMVQAKIRVIVYLILQTKKPLWRGYYYCITNNRHCLQISDNFTPFSHEIISKVM